MEEIYHKDFFALDLKRLIERYGGAYKSFFRWFRPSFYRDKKTIARVSHSGKVPALVHGDLVDAHRVNLLRTKLDSEKEHVRGLLGRFYQGYDTDFNLVERAVDVASMALKLAGVVQAPPDLTAQISLGGRASPNLRIFGDRLLDSINRWELEAEALASLIPLKRLPGSELPIQHTPFSKVKDWAHETEEHLASLNNLTGKVFKVCHAEFPGSYQELLTDLKTSEKLKSLELDISAESERLQKKFGIRYSGLYTNWDDVLSALDWTRQVFYLFDSRPIPPLFVKLVCNRDDVIPSNNSLKEAYQTTKTHIKTVEAQFEPPEPTYEGQSISKLPLDILEDRLRLLHARIDELQVWIDFQKIKNRFEEVGMRRLLSQVMNKPPKAAQLIQVFHKAVYHDWINSVFDEDLKLGAFRGRNHDQRISEFRKLDRKMIRLSPQRVITNANSKKPSGMLVQARDAEISILRREGAKKRRHMPIRRLFERMPNLVLRLKPCLLMGPLSVSQFLSPERFHFDLVIFDEASQICPEDAVGAIYRGKQLVVAGDDKQLPPTTFFQKSMVEEYDWDDIEEDDFDVFESILDECNAIGLPAKMLRWHYRSKHESLIAFSNNRFYKNRLVTFPSPFSEQETLGVKFVYVPDGIYDRGGRRNNLREAEVVADLVFDHFERFPSKSLGVVAFSIAHADIIEEEIERRRRDRSEFEVFFKEDRLRGFFVKNLENVQGDERDVMIFSVGYGYDQQRRITMNFGPLNRSGGERRLNVAITRAREKVILVSSIKASDIDLTSPRPAGVMNLYHYLDYAERGEAALELSSPMYGEAFESPLEDDVAREIQRLGYDVVSQVGCSGYRIDLAVVDPAKPGRFILGVECDGATYYSANIARDRDRLRQQVLESFGWCIHRVWSPDWVNRRNTEIKRLENAIERAQQFPLKDNSGKTNPVSTVHEEPLTAEVEIQQVKFNGIKEIGTPYKVSELKATFKQYIRVSTSRWPYFSEMKNDFHMRENLPEQSRLLAKLVEDEGPIHFDYAVKRLTKAWGSKRVSSKIIDAVNQAVKICLNNGLIRVKGAFLWPPNLSLIHI